MKKDIKKNKNKNKRVVKHNKERREMQWEIRDCFGHRLGTHRGDNKRFHLFFFDVLKIALTRSHTSLFIGWFVLSLLWTSLASLVVLLFLSSSPPQYSYFYFLFAHSSSNYTIIHCYHTYIIIIYIIIWPG